MSELTVKQQKFADEYIISWNATEAYYKAGYKVKSDGAARANSSRLLTNANIKIYIDKRLEKLKKESIAEQDEIMQYLTSIVRGEQKEETLRGVGMGEQIKTSIDVSAKDRIKAAELLGKRYAMWTEKQDISGSIGLVQIVDDIPSDDDG